MNDLAALGVEIPSIPYIAGLIVFGIVGWVVFRRGRKLSNSVLTWSGVALMVGVFFWLGLREVDLASPEAVDVA